MATNSNENNIVKKFGKPHLNAPEGASTKTAKNRGFPMKGTNSEDGEFWTKGIDINTYCRQYPDGTREYVNYGKKPSRSIRQAGSSHEEHLNNGQYYRHIASAMHSQVKGDLAENHNGSRDSKQENAARDNSGNEKGGGRYADAGKGGSASGSGKGGMASYSDGSITTASAKNNKSVAGGTNTMGAGDAGGKHAQFVTLTEKNEVIISTEPRSGAGGTGVGADGGGCVVMTMAKSGDIKMTCLGSGRQSQFTMGKDGSMSMSGKGNMSFSTTGAMNFAASSYKWQPAPGAPRTDKPPDHTTSYGAEKGFSDSKFDSDSSSQPQPEVKQCPPGYRYDVNIMRCVLDDAFICPQGQTWDFDLNECVIDPNQPAPLFTTPTTQLVQQQQSPVQQQQVEQQELQQRVQQIESTILDDRIRLLIQQQMQIANITQTANTEHS